MKLFAWIVIALTLWYANSVGAEYVAPIPAPPFKVTFPWATLQELVQVSGYPSSGGCPGGVGVHIFRGISGEEGYVVFVADSLRVVAARYAIHESNLPTHVGEGRLTPDGQFVDLRWREYAAGESPCAGLVK